MTHTFIYSNPLEVAAEFAQALLDQTKGKDVFHVALSGGSTPKLLFECIAHTYDDDFDWKKIHLWWGDERCVPPTDNESNFKMTRELLIDKVSIPAHNVHRILGEKDPTEEAKRYAGEITAHLPQHNNLPRFDLIILGMGDDGHTASIFPHQIELLNAEKICAVATHPTSGQKRITLTGHTLNNAAEVAFLITGENKREKIKAIFTRQANYLDLPSAHIQPTDGNLSWYLDQAAAV